MWPIIDDLKNTKISGRKFVAEYGLEDDENELNIAGLVFDLDYDLSCSDRVHGKQDWGLGMKPGHSNTWIR